MYIPVEEVEESGYVLGPRGHRREEHCAHRVPRREHRGVTAPQEELLLPRQRRSHLYLRSLMRFLKLESVVDNFLAIGFVFRWKLETRLAPLLTESAGPSSLSSSFAFALR